jgi:hypothetical protein
MANTGGQITWVLDVDSAKFTSGLKEASDQASSTAKEIDGKLGRAFKNATAGSQAFGKGIIGLGAGIGGLIAKTTLTAARTETLGVAMNAIAKATNTSTEELAKQEAMMKKQGIATQEARQILSMFMQSQLDVADAAKVSRVAQDLAVIAGKNSSDTANILAESIANQNVLMLRQFGIVTTTTKIFDNYAETIGKTGDDLTDLEKRQAFVNEILAQGGNVAGTYEAAMTTVGKKLGSLDRHFQEAATTIGTVFLPTFGLLIDKLTDFLTGIDDESVQSFLMFFENHGTVIAGIIIGGLVPAFTSLAASLWALYAPLAPFLAAGAILGFIIQSLVTHMGGWQAVMDKLQPTFQLLSDIWNYYILPALQMAWEALQNNLIPAFQGLGEALAPLLPALKWMGIVFAGVVFVAIMGVIGGVILLINALANLVNGVKRYINDVVWVFQWLYDRLIGNSIIPDLINGIVDWFAGLPDMIATALSGLFSAITGPFESAFNKIWNMAKDTASKIRNALKDAFNIKKKNSPSISDRLRELQNATQSTFNAIDVPEFRQKLSSNLAAGSGGDFGVSRSQPNLVVNVGTYAGSDMEKRELAKELFDALEDYRKGRGEI